MNIGKYKVGELIGEGAYGKVYKATDDEKNSYAIKIINTYKLSEKVVNEINEEIEMMKKLSRGDEDDNGYMYISNIIDVYIEEDKKIYAIIMEDLSDWMTIDKLIKYVYEESKKKMEIPRLTPMILNKIIYQLIDGLNWIHSNGIAHRDIKPENIMVDKLDFKIKYIDFGFACSTKCNYDKGTILYMPPESKNNLKDDEKSRLKDSIKHDIWSLGLVIYGIVNIHKYPNNYPFDVKGKKAAGFFEYIRKNPYKYEKSNYLYEYGYKGLNFNLLIYFMLNKDPNVRWDTDKLLEHIEEKKTSGI